MAEWLVQRVAAQWVDLSLKLALMTLYTAIVWLAISTGALMNPFNDAYQYRIGAILMNFGAIYSAIMLLVTGVRAIMVMSYRPMASLSDEELPTVTVVIPAYNEGVDVARSIDSIARSNYPREKLQNIAVDDGSKDDTWLHMDAAAKRYPDIVCAIRMEKNGGKRQGLRVGFALAAGDVLVTMDSDCTVERDALRSLVTPIAKDPRIGAVAGNVKVLNRSEGILPRMMRASFVIAFDFTRAYQARIGAVLCTPGAFSAYRRSAVEAVLGDWNHQTFLGKPSTIAEDRALTNLILRDGHEITFQSDATVWTTVPTTYKQMARMYQRWERGNVRENLTYGTFCFKPFRKRYRWAANLEWFLGVTDMVFPYILINRVAGVRNSQSVLPAQIPGLRDPLFRHHADPLHHAGKKFRLHLRRALFAVLFHRPLVGGSLQHSDRGQRQLDDPQRPGNRHANATVGPGNHIRTHPRTPRGLIHVFSFRNQMGSSIGCHAFGPNFESGNARSKIYPIAGGGLKACSRIDAAIAAGLSPPSAGEKISLAGAARAGKHAFGRREMPGQWRASIWFWRCGAGPNPCHPTWVFRLR